MEYNLSMYEQLIKAGIIALLITAIYMFVDMAVKKVNEPSPYEKILMEETKRSQ